jgi:hypothetical protein
VYLLPSATESWDELADAPPPVSEESAAVGIKKKQPFRLLQAPVIPVRIVAGVTLAASRVETRYMGGALTMAMLIFL